MLLPSIDILQEELRALRRERSPDRVHSRLAGLLEHYEVLNYDLTLNRPLFRAQKCASEGFGKIQRLMYPPASLARIGRANEKGEPRLYASIDVQTCLAELGAREGEFFHVIALRPQKRMLRCAVVGEFEAAHKGGSTISPAIAETLAKVSRNSRRDATLAFLFLDAMMASLLNDVNAREVGYIYSRTLSRLIFEKLGKVEAIAYPSARRPAAKNFALTMRAADEMQVMGSSVLKIKGAYDFGLFDMEIVRDAVSWEDGTIRWA